SPKLRNATEEIWLRQDLRPELAGRLSTDKALSLQQEMHILLALLPAHPEYAVPLARYMILYADFDECDVLLRALEAPGPEIKPSLSQVVSEADSTPDMQMRALVALLKCTDSRLHT